MLVVVTPVVTLKDVKRALAKDRSLKIEISGQSRVLDLTSELIPALHQDKVCNHVTGVVRVTANKVEGLGMPATLILIDADAKIDKPVSLLDLSI